MVPIGDRRVPVLEEIGLTQTLRRNPLKVILFRGGVGISQANGQLISTRMPLETCCQCSPERDCAYAGTRYPAHSLASSLKCRDTLFLCILSVSNRRASRKVSELVTEAHVMLWERTA